MKIDLDHLASATANLECGHPIEAVLRQHGIPDRWSAYDVVERQQKNQRNLESAKSEFYKQFWADAVKELQPCIAAIKRHINSHDQE